MGRAWGRLPERSDFLRVAALGIRQGTPAFLLQGAVQATELDQMRVGFTASRKIGNAVIRNRAKRRLRAAVDAALGMMTQKNVDMVLVARHSATTRDFSEMTADLRKAAERVMRQLSQRPPAPTVAP